MREKKMPLTLQEKLKEAKKKGSVKEIDRTYNFRNWMQAR